MAFTFFFRDLHVLELVAKFLIPEISGRTRPSIWDAGCAMGQEPYTLAMVLAENMGQFGFNNLRICASDHDESGNFGEIIKNAVYPKQELERIPPEIFQKYFEPTEQEGHFRVVQKIRDRITYQKHDLLSLQPIGHSFSLVLCKNVLLHFQHEQRVNVIRMFHSVLNPGGLIAFEQTQKMPSELAGMFEQVVSDGQIFRKK